MGNRGRFGKYGDLKRKEKIRQNLFFQAGPAARTSKYHTIKAQQPQENQPRNKPK